MSAARLRSTGLLVGGVALGVAVAVGLPKLLDGPDQTQALGRSADVSPASLLDAGDLADVEGGRERTGSPREAVERFLAAERAGEDDVSFALLADEVRLDYGSAAAWAADPDSLAPVTGYEVLGEPAAAGDTATVETETRYRSSLDAVAGLVPARARTSWAVVREEGGWAVDLFATEQVPLLPPDDEAVSAVRAWAAAAQDCTPQPRPLVGQQSLAEGLCDAPGAVAVGPAAPLAAVDAGQLQSALGADAESWARTVDLTSPGPLRAVVAPIDDTWTVIAVLPTTGAGS